MANPDLSAVSGMKEPIYRLRLKSAGCCYDVLVNDCPAFSVTKDRNVENLPVTVNGWLNKGTSQLRILVRPLPNAEKLDSAAAKLSVSVTVADMTESIDTRDEIELVTVELDAANQDTGQYPISLTADFDVPTSFPQWAWRSAPELTNDDQLRDDASRLLEELGDHLSQRDARATAGMQRAKTREMAAAMFQPQSERENDVVSEIERVITDGQAQIEVINPDDAVFSYFADERLVRLDDSEGNSAVRIEFPNMGMKASMPVFVTRDKGGRLLWIR